MKNEAIDLAGDFPAVEMAQWRAAVDRALSRDPDALSAAEREALFNRKLVTQTYDGIAIQPLYRPDDAPATRLGLVGRGVIAAAANGGGTHPGGWDVRSRVQLEGDGAATAVRARGELEGGASSLLLETAGFDADVDLLDRALDGVHLDLAPVVLDSGDRFGAWGRALAALWQRRGIAPAAGGNLGADPLGHLARCADWPRATRLLDECRELAREVGDHAGIASVVADATPYHEAGGSDVEELGCALATGVEYLRLLVGAGLDVDTALARIELRLAATSDQFLTIAKLRAARLAWDRIAAVAGAGAARPSLALHAQMSRAMQTRYDPWVNLLRGTVACFAAGIGGATAVTVDPFDAVSRGTASHLGSRMARNTQAVVIDEAHVGRVVDPAGGCWYVESLTEAVAEHAWSWFQEIETHGGMLAALREGVVQRRIAATWQKRQRNIARRRDPITGVSEFPNIAEEIPAPAAAATAPAGLPVVRYAAEFEALRERADAVARQRGARPAVFLATLGPLAEHTPRASFCKNLFEAGGFATLSAGTVDAESVAEHYRASGAAMACLCGSDERYAAEAEAVARALRAAGARRIYLGGAVESLRERLVASGVDEFVVMGCDAVEVLQRAHATLGESADA